MRIEVVIKRLSVSGLTVRSRETLIHTLASSIARQLEASLDAAGTPAVSREALHIRHLSAPAARVRPGPGLDARIARGVARSFCAGLTEVAGPRADPVRTSPTAAGSGMHNGNGE